MLRGGKFALGLTCGIFIVILTYLVFDLIGNGLTRSEILDVLPALLTLLVALTSLIISFYALSEQRLMRQAGTDPVVLIHLDNRDDARIVSTLEIRNVGSGAAQNVQLELLTDISEFFPKRIFTDFSRIVHPIRTIPQGRSISFNFGVGNKLLNDPPIPPIEFRVSYENIEGERHSSKQYIDVKELTLQRADDGLQSRATKATERTAKALEGMQGIKPIRVISQTKAEKDAEFAEWAAQLKLEQEDN